MNSKNKFIKWCEENAHKFVVISYQGGAGGEGLCNWLTQETDFFFNKEIIKMSYDQGIIPENLMAMIDSVANPKRKNGQVNNDVAVNPSSHRQKTFFDFLFADVFVLDGVDNLYTSHCWVPEYENIPIIPEETLENPFGLLWDHIKNRKDPDSERPQIMDYALNEIRDAFANQDKPYLIRTHGITPLTMCWGPKAKYFSISGGNYQEYIQMLETMKVYLQPEWEYERKLEAIRIADWRYQKGITGIWGEKSNAYYLEKDWEPKYTTDENIERYRRYLAPILDDDTIPLYYRTLDIVGQHKNFGVNIEQLDCITLNNIVYGTMVSKFWPRISISYFKNDAVTLKRLEMKEQDFEKVHAAMGDKISPYDMNWPDSERARKVTIDFWEKNHKVRDHMGIIQVTFDQLYNPDYLIDNGIDIDPENYLMYWNNWHDKSLKALTKVKLFPRRVPLTL